MNSQHPASEDHKPIKSYGAIGNTFTVALVNLDGSIDWCCLPRFDSASIFAAILDTQRGGRFRITPAVQFKSSQTYLPGTNVLKTVFHAGSSVVELLDFMPVFRQKTETIGLPEIHRRLRCSEGTMNLLLEFSPRPNYGLNEPHIRKERSGIQANYANEHLTLTATAPYGKIRLSEQIHLNRGETIWLSLLFSVGPTPTSDWRPNASAKLSTTIRYWQGWSAQCRYNGRWRDVVQRSALALKLLSYSRTGTLVAAATTSLPEKIGGSQNWDYRYTWIRDSAYSLQALRRLGYDQEGKAFLQWLKSKCERGIGRLQIMFDVEGGGDLPELILPHLEGYMHSYPVRIGNAASAQFQLDIFGEILDSIYFLHERGRGMQRPEYEMMVQGLANYICEAYNLPDSGIWEVRSGPKHFVYSKLWCWVGLDRAERLAEEMGQREDARRWRQFKGHIKKEILTKGWSRRKRCFRQHYETEEPDAANLLMPLVGFISPNHPKFVANLETTIRELSTDGLVYRYKRDDGTTEREGTFTLCTLWLVDCLAKMGRLTEATTLFERVLRHANHVGLYSEEIDPETGEALGNFPQAFTHLNIINAALSLESEARRRGNAIKTVST